MCTLTSSFYCASNTDSVSSLSVGDRVAQSNASPENVSTGSASVDTSQCRRADRGDVRGSRCPQAQVASLPLHVRSGTSLWAWLLRLAPPTAQLPAASAAARPRPPPALPAASAAAGSQTPPELSACGRAALPWRLLMCAAAAPRGGEPSPPKLPDAGGAMGAEVEDSVWPRLETPVLRRPEAAAGCSVTWRAPAFQTHM